MRESYSFSTSAGRVLCTVTTPSGWEVSVDRRSQQDLRHRCIAGFDLWFADDADDDADEVIFSGREPSEAFFYMDGYIDIDASSELSRC